MFKYNPKITPDVKLEREWKLKDSRVCQSYRVGDWSMELPDDGNLEEIEQAIYSWIAWYDFIDTNNKLKEQKEDK